MAGSSHDTGFRGIHLPTSVLDVLRRRWRQLGLWVFTPFATPGVSLAHGVLIVPHDAGPLKVMKLILS